MRRFLFPVLLIVFVIWAAGGRLDIQALFERLPTHKLDYRRLVFADGTNIVAVLVKETPDKVEIKMGDGITVFRRSEISQLEKIDPAQIAAGGYASEIVQSDPKPVFTFRTEDNILSVTQSLMNRMSGVSRSAPTVYAGKPRGNYTHSAPVQRVKDTLHNNGIKFQDEVKDDKDYAR